MPFDLSGAARNRARKGGDIAPREHALAVALAAPWEIGMVGKHVARIEAPWATKVIARASAQPMRGALVRIDVATIIGAVAAGDTVETVAAQYALGVEQVRSALSYGAYIRAHVPPAVRQTP
jgi:hypothetical protein